MPARLFRTLVARTRARTRYPAARKARTTADPTKPLAPVTSTRSWWVIEVDYRRERRSSQPTRCSQLALRIRVDDRRHHEPGEAEHRLENEHGGEKLERPGPDATADDVRIEHVLELVDDHEK